MRIVHISDLHVGRNWMFSRDMLEQGIDLINETAPDAVVVTGDLTDWGLREEYGMVRKFLERIRPDLYLVAGNHDARTNGYRIFEEMFCTERHRYYHTDMGDWRLIGLDSSEPDIDDGHIGREQMRWLSEALDTDRKKMLMLHHHLIPIPDTGRDRNILVDAGTVLKLLVENRTDIVLTGHKHMPFVWELNGMPIVTAGTLACRRAFAGNSLNVLDLEDEVRVTRVELPGGNEVRML